MKSFEFATATEIVFGHGTAKTIGHRLRGAGTRAFVVTGQDPVRAAPVVDGLTEAGFRCRAWRFAGEPTISEATEATRAARERGIDVVVSVGGGSAIDLGKAVSVLLTNDGDPLEYVEVIGKGRALATPPVPFVAVPTTAGTGAEVTRNAVLSSPESGVKVSMRSPLMLPRLAVVDPDMTRGLPPAIAAATGLDALTQLVEPFLSTRATPLTDAFCVDGIRRAARALERACLDGGDDAARADMALASLLGGLALANAGLGAAHGFAAPIGGRYGAPHGAVCAALLPAVMAVNLDVARRRGASADLFDRFATVARLVTGDPAASPDDGVRWVQALCRRLGIRGLAAMGAKAGELPAIVRDAARASSMRANPVPLETADLERILEHAW